MGGDEVEVLQSLAILEYLAINNAMGRIVKNENVFCVQEQVLAGVIYNGRKLRLQRIRESAF